MRDSAHGRNYYGYYIYIYIYLICVFFHVNIPAFGGLEPPFLFS